MALELLNDIQGHAAIDLLLLHASLEVLELGERGAHAAGLEDGFGEVGGEVVTDLVGLVHLLLDVLLAGPVSLVQALVHAVEVELEVVALLVGVLDHAHLLHHADPGADLLLHVLLGFDHLLDELVGEVLGLHVILVLGVPAEPLEGVLVLEVGEVILVTAHELLHELLDEVLPHEVVDELLLVSGEASLLFLVDQAHGDGDVVVEEGGVDQGVALASASLLGLLHLDDPLLHVVLAEAALHGLHLGPLLHDALPLVAGVDGADGQEGQGNDAEHLHLVNVESMETTRIKRHY